MFYPHRRSTLAARIGQQSAVRRRALCLFVITMIASLALGGLLHRAQASSDCVLDPTFDRDGKRTTDFFGDDDFARGMVIQPDGKIILAGETETGGHQFALARYHTDGSPDFSFGNKGKVTTSFSYDGAGATDVALQADGKIVAAGYGFTGLSSYPDFALARYHTDGSLDSTFGDGGKVLTDFFNHFEVVTAVAIQTDGKIVAGGWLINPNSSSRDFALARYNTDGSLDPTFDGDGQLTTDFSYYDDYLSDIAIQPDGKIIAVGTGTFGPDIDFLKADLVASRYNTDGSLDATFDGDGQLISDFTDYDSASSVALQPDGKIVIAGDIMLLRYKTDGSLDDTFGMNGLVSGLPIGVSNIVIQPNGKIVLSGYTPGLSSSNGYTYDFALARINKNGTLDTSFGSDGKNTADFFCYDDVASAVALQPDGRIVVAGYSGQGLYQQRDFALARFNPDGASAQPRLLSVVLSRSTVPGCQGLTGVVTLCAPAPAGGLEVKLTDNLEAASLPASVVVPEGATTACFTINTTPVHSIQSGNIVGKLDGTARSATLTVRPISIASLEFHPVSIMGPGNITGTVTLECPAPDGGVTVQLVSRNPRLASLTTDSITIPARARARNFRVHVANVDYYREMVITATANGISKSGVLAVY
jgi:uncharacterized delta-60 repeat protein